MNRLSYFIFPFLAHYASCGGPPTSKNDTWLCHFHLEYISLDSRAGLSPYFTAKNKFF